MAETDKTTKKPEAGGEAEISTLPLWDSPMANTVVWAVAGFDPSSGAGVTADLMTFAAHGLFGCSVITALTVQTTLGVFGWEPVQTSLIAASLQRLEEDLPFAGVKIGMLGTAQTAAAVGELLQRQRQRKRRQHVVVDPVLRSSSGKELLSAAGLAVLREDVLPFTDWITPNWAELAALADLPVTDEVSVEAAAKVLLARYPALHIVATGGDQQGRPVDLLFGPEGVQERFVGTRVETTGTHGTGCAFSSALLCQLVRGAGPVEAVRAAKSFVEGALRAAPGVGHGRGPMGLLWPLQQRRQEGCEKESESDVASLKR